VARRVARWVARMAEGRRRGAGARVGCVIPGKIGEADKGSGEGRTALLPLDLKWWARTGGPSELRCLPLPQLYPPLTRRCPRRCPRRWPTLHRAGRTKDPGPRGGGYERAGSTPLQLLVEEVEEVEEEKNARRECVAYAVGGSRQASTRQYRTGARLVRASLSSTIRAPAVTWARYRVREMSVWTGARGPRNPGREP
jgi:hypothetical protein